MAPPERQPAARPSSNEMHPVTGIRTPAHRPAHDESPYRAHHTRNTRQSDGPKILIAGGNRETSPGTVSESTSQAVSFSTNRTTCTGRNSGNVPSLVATCLVHANRRRIHRSTNQGLELATVPTAGAGAGAAATGRLACRGAPVYLTFVSKYCKTSQICHGSQYEQGPIVSGLLSVLLEHSSSGMQLGRERVQVRLDDSLLHVLVLGRAASRQSGSLQSQDSLPRRDAARLGRNFASPRPTNSCTLDRPSTRDSQTRHATVGE